MSDGLETGRRNGLLLRGTRHHQADRCAWDCIDYTCESLASLSPCLTLKGIGTHLIRYLLSTRSSQLCGGQELKHTA